VTQLRSLRGLTLVFIAAFMAATLGTGLISYNETSRTIARLVDSRLATTADAMAPVGTAYETGELLRRMKALDDDRDTGDLGIVLTDAAGHRLGGNVALLRRLPLGFSVLRRHDRIKGLSQGRAYVRGVGDGRLLTVIGETEPVDNYAAARIRIYVTGFGTIVFVVLIGMLLFARVVSARITAIRETAGAIIAGDMGHRVPVQGDRGVFDAQAATFNLMLDRIADLMRGMSNISSDIAHDLRTPLARLRIQLQTLARQAETSAMHEGIARAVAQNDELLAMFAAVLRIAEVEAGDRRAGFGSLEIDTLAREVAVMMLPVAEDSGRTIVFTPSPLVTIRGDRQLLTQLLINLIENGLRHTPAGSRISIAVSRLDDVARLTVSDDGQGIAPEQRALALRRFGRLDASRRALTPDHKTVGHGLGLALVDAIVRLHDGSLHLEDAAPGLRVVVKLPTPSRQQPGPGIAPAG